MLFCASIIVGKLLNRTMRHFSLMKLLTASSLSTSLSDGLSTQHQTGRCRSTKQALVTSSTSDCNGFTTEQQHPTNRRQMLSSVVGLSAGLAFVSGKSNALDMDAFVNSQLEADKTNCNPKTDSKCIPKLSPDEAMCKYGQSGVARGEACLRVKESGGKLPKTSGPPVKSLGGAYAM